ncbi:MAG: aminotransferase class IV, partial [Pirellulales bacterium]|nr:aminotransferase class IV [Pirellulales bacterium]
MTQNIVHLHLIRPVPFTRFRAPSDAGILEGITRNAVMDIAREMGVEVLEIALTKYDAYVADECFLTGSAAEV